MFLERYFPLFYRREQRVDAGAVIRGLLSDIERKTCEPVARREGRGRPRGESRRTRIRRRPAACQKRIPGATRYRMLEKGTLKMTHLKPPGRGILPVRVLKSVAG